MDLDASKTKMRQINEMYDMSSQMGYNLNNKTSNNKLPSMGMSVIRQQSQQTYSTDQQQGQLPTSTKSEKKIFSTSTRQGQHKRRRRRHKSSEDEPHETTPSISSSSSMGRVSHPGYDYDESLNDEKIANFQGTNKS